MASRYDDLDASLELEQQLAAELKAAFEPRGCEVVHHGSNAGSRHSPGGKPDIEIIDRQNRHLVLVEVTKRKGSAADGEFAAVTDHLERKIKEREFDSYGLLYVSPRTSARMSMNFRDLYNRRNERDGRLGRVLAVDFEAIQLMIDKLMTSDAALYPSVRLKQLFEQWDKAVDDARARLLIQSTIFPEDNELADALEEESREFDALRERELKKQLEHVENKFRSHGITGNNANISLVYLAFLRLFEERSQRQTGKPNRFTADGFREWSASVAKTTQRQFENRLVELLLHEIAEEDELKAADLLQRRSNEQFLHNKLSDDLVETLILPVFDNYDFHAGRVDILGAVFETLARRGDKDTRVGQFFTPQQVVDFCAEIVQIRSTDRVLDPAVGTGRFLISAMDAMLDDSDRSSRDRSKIEESIRRDQLIGTDIDEWVATIAKMNMFIHGDGKSGVVSANGLTLGHHPVLPNSTSGINSSVDVVLTNPPLGDTDYLVAESEWERLASVFTAGHWDADSLVVKAETFYNWLGVVPLETLEETQLAKLYEKRDDVQEKIRRALQDTGSAQSTISRLNSRLDAINAEIAELRTKIAQDTVTRRPRGRMLKGGALFIGAIAQYLKAERLPGEKVEWAGGQAAIVVDEAVLNTPEYAHVRDFIRTHFFVKGVVSLSRDAFKYLAHTDAKTSILFLSKKPDMSLSQREPIFYAHAERVGYNAVGKWIGNDLPLVRDFYRYFCSAIEKSYRGKYIDERTALSAAQSVPGHSTAFIARSPEGHRSDRLDFYHARFNQRREELLAKHGKLISFGDVLEIASVKHPPASRTGEYDFAVATRTGTVAYKGRASVAYSPRSLWVVENGDLILSSIDLVHGAIAVAGQDVAGLVMSKEMYPYRVRPGVEAVPEYVQILLRTKAAQEMLYGFATGTSNRTRLESAEKLLEFPLPPLPALSEQIVRAQQLQEAYAQQRRALETIEALGQEAQEVWGPPVDIYSDVDDNSLPVVEAF
ncbi:N-6 DNA methylase [Glycomyces artemisiae]|uniref:site-specific DNA-methyltransferase (adenine-specific) n=1 Tax=Glycomyces artemisiae TaxID=1076443 RepID=A0A2T0UD43_9ACTN|nr:N-6 DNA methylase [Glycomyces artemisiae]PRY55727.1 N-6 DNA methylase [Glycomyces artemisiae]